MDALYYDRAHGITTIDARYIKPGIASIQMMVQDGRASFFDTGTTRSLPFVLDVMRAKGLRDTDVDFVIPTHVHLDHAGGAGAMMRVFPNARLVIHPRGARHMIDPSRLWAGTTHVYGEDAARELYGEVVPIDESRILVAADEFKLDFNGRRLLFLDTPGHARHHFCVVDSQNHVIFAGDTMGISYRALDGPNGPFVFPTSSPVQFEPDALHRSIDRLMATRPKSIFMTHFGEIEASANMAQMLHRRIDGYVRIANQLAGSANPESELRRAITDYMLNEAVRHGVPLPPDDIREVLNMDAKLNADGIAVWLARRTKTPTSPT